MKKILKLVASVLFCSTVFAQNETDVLRNSTTDIFGSARFEAMAGSFGGLGADFSVIQVNPASLARFSSSRFTFALNNSFITNKGSYNDMMADASRNKLSVGAIGAVFTNEIRGGGSARRYGQITVGYTRLKNFNNTRKYEGQNFYSLLDVLAADGYGIDPNNIYDARPFTTGLAYDVFAVDYDASTEEYYSRLTAGDMYHEREILTDGGIGEFHIGYSENYMNNFYYGASIGIRNSKYIESFNHRETLLDTLGTSLRYFDYFYDQKSRGLGVNIKLGIVYLPIEEVRLGLSFESPTVFRMKDEWSNNMNAMHDDGMKFIAPEFIPEGKYEYRLKTPMKLRGSFAYVFGMRGAVNVDLEMARLPGGKLRPAVSSLDDGFGDTYGFEVENGEVKNQFRTVLNTRIGVEYMLVDDFFLRGGIAILPQPYKKSIGNVNIPNMTYSVGLGWENHIFQIDLSYRLLKMTEDYYAFDPSKIENRTNFKTNMNSIVLTAGLKF